MPGVETNFWIVMHQRGDGQPMIQDRTELGPGWPPLTALAQYSEPTARHLGSESRQHRQVPGHSMVLVVSPQYAAQPFSDLGNRLMHPPAELLLEFSQFRPPSFAVRNAPDLEPASFGIRTDMFESQKGERLRF